MQKIKRLLALHAPGLHAVAMRLRFLSVRFGRTPHRAIANARLRLSPSVQLAVTEQAGIGGLLRQVGSALDLGVRLRKEVTVLLESPTYAPPLSTGDWLENYFVRNSVATFSGPRISVTDVIHSHKSALTVAEGSQLVWNYMRIRPELQQRASDLAPGEFIAVHYRGSDKKYEAARADVDAVLDEVGHQLEERNMSSLFIASDERAFIEKASLRFKNSFALPQMVVAENGRPPHFTNAPGDLKAQEALLTMLVLSKATVLVRTESFLSEWAHTLSNGQLEIVVRGGTPSPRFQRHSRPGEQSESMSPGDAP